MGKLKPPMVTTPVRKSGVCMILARGPQIQRTTLAIMIATPMVSTPCSGTFP